MVQQNRPIVYFVALAIVACGACIGWWLRNPESSGSFQAPVISGSMATTAPGPHYALQCYDCKIPLIVDATTVSNENLPVCFNCGASNSLDDISVSMISVSCVEVRDKDLQRWQRVVFDYDDTRYLKRIIGLPGEKIAIEGGELFVDGNLYQKDLTEFDQLSTLVFDSRYQPLDSSYDMLKRFEARADDLGWIYTLDKVFAFDAPEKTHLQWMDYHHWNVVAGFVPHTQRGTPTAIFDYLPYNQFISRTQLNFVDDVVADLTLRIYEPGVVGLRLLDIELEFDFKQFNVRIRQSDSVRASFSFPRVRWNDKGTDVELRAGLLDGRLVIQINSLEPERGISIQRPVLTGNFETDLAKRTTPLSISADEGSLDLTHLKIARDIYWLGADYTASRWEPEWTGKGASFLLIGDNQPVSRDCRQWGEGIGREAIVGRMID